MNGYENLLKAASGIKVQLEQLREQQLELDGEVAFGFRMADPESRATTMAAIAKYSDELTILNLQLDQIHLLNLVELCGMFGFFSSSHQYYWIKEMLIRTYGSIIRDNTEIYLVVPKSRYR